MTIDPAQLEAAGLTVTVEGKTARVTQGEAELAQVSLQSGQLVFLPERSAKQKAVLRLIGALD